MHSADGAYKALREILKRCDKAGEKYCGFAAGDPVENFETIAAKLRAKPLVVTDEFGYLHDHLRRLRRRDPRLALRNVRGGFRGRPAASQLWTLLAAPAATSADKAAAKKAVIERIKEARSRKPAPRLPVRQPLRGLQRCDVHRRLPPKDAASWPAATAKADKRAPYFGRAWAWGSVQCARNSWTVRDEDAYTGPFNRRTAAPVLVRRQLLGPGHELRGGRLLGEAPAEQPPAVQHELGPHRLRHVGLRDDRDRQLPAQGHAARQGQGLSG